jgi:hypothetical protein
VLGRILEVHQQSGAKESAYRRRRDRRWLDELGLLTFNIGSLVAEGSVVIQMCWGAINELTAQAAYSRMIAKAEHPVLTELVRRIMKQEGRYLDFYEHEARSRLEGNRRAQRLARFALTKFWSPVGSGVVPDGEEAYMASYLFADPADRKFACLPGLHGLTLLEDAARRDRPLRPRGRLPRLLSDKMAETTTAPQL